MSHSETTTEATDSADRRALDALLKTIRQQDATIRELQARLADARLRDADAKLEVRK